MDNRRFKTAGALLISLFMILGGIFLPAPIWASTVQVEVIHGQDRYQVDREFPVLFRLKITKPWYIHGAEKGESALIPTSLAFQKTPGLEITDIKFPQAEKKNFDFSPQPIDVLSGEILVRATLRVQQKASLGKHVIQGHLSYQACEGARCRMPEEVPVSLTVNLVPSDTLVTLHNQDLFLAKEPSPGPGTGTGPFRPGTGFLLSLLGIFLGGLALNLTPCVYPLIPITVSFFSGRKQMPPGHAMLHGLLYVGGLALTNSILGLSAALSGGLLGSALQHPWVLIFVACVMVALAASFFGLWELRLPTRLTTAASKNYGGFFGSFFMGLTLGIVAAPCIGPFILGLLTYVGQTGDPFIGFIYFFVLSLGMGIPLALLGIFSGAVQRLPLSGDWMLWVRKLMGWVLLGMAAYILSPLLPNNWGFPSALALLLIPAGIHLGWIDRSGRAPGKFTYFKRVLGLLMAAVGCVALLWPAAEGISVQWLPYDQKSLAAAASKKQPVILDFYADWCEPCRAMDEEVFSDPGVVRLSQNFLTMRVDLTKRQPYQDALLRKYKVRGVPTVLFLNREGLEEESLRVEYLVSRSQFLDRMSRALNGPPK
ncbi:MAG: thioredoxin family protein [Deltaproteobacteria bacterium]|nr:thioredoxin family protein [Deltaproteobacteria bacterium]